MDRKLSNRFNSVTSQNKERVANLICICPVSEGAAFGDGDDNDDSDEDNDQDGEAKLLFDLNEILIKCTPTIKLKNECIK